MTCLFIDKKSIGHKEPQDKPISSYNTLEQPTCEGERFITKAEHAIAINNNNDSLKNALHEAVARSSSIKQVALIGEENNTASTINNFSVDQSSNKTTSTLGYDSTPIATELHYEKYTSSGNDTEVQTPEHENEEPALLIEDVTNLSTYTTSVVDIKYSPLSSNARKSLLKKVPKKLTKSNELIEQQKQKNVPKTKSRCKHWSYCTNNNCKFVHPTEFCR